MVLDELTDAAMVYYDARRSRLQRQKQKVLNDIRDLNREIDCEVAKRKRHSLAGVASDLKKKLGGDPPVEYVEAVKLQLDLRRLIAGERETMHHCIKGLMFARFLSDYVNTFRGKDVDITAAELVEALRANGSLSIVCGDVLDNRKAVGHLVRGVIHKKMHDTSGNEFEMRRRQGSQGVVYMIRFNRKTNKQPTTNN